MCRDPARAAAIVATSILIGLVCLVACGDTPSGDAGDDEAVGARPGPDWTLECVETRGFGDEKNVGVVALKVIDDALWLGTWNVATGGMLYRSRDGSAWSRMNTGGFGNAKHFAVISIARFKDHVYAGTWNMKESCALYRATLGTPAPRWERVMSGGFGDPENKAVTVLHSFRGQLYAGCYNQKNGCQVWRSASGDAGTFARVNRDGFGEAANSDATQMLTHRGALYVSTESLRRQGVGCQVWRTQGVFADGSDGRDGWTLVSDDGFGDATNINIWGFAAFRDRLYASTWNPPNGFQVWRTTKDDAQPTIAWERVVDKGFDDRRNYMATSLAVVEGTLFLGAIGKFQVDGDAIEGTARIERAVGETLLATTDGTRWHRIDAPGFLSPRLLGVSALAAFRGALWIGGMAQDRPLEVWVARPRTARPATRPPGSRDRTPPDSAPPTRRSATRFAVGPRG